MRLDSPTPSVVLSSPLTLVTVTVFTLSPPTDTKRVLDTFSAVTFTVKWQYQDNLICPELLDVVSSPVESTSTAAGYTISTSSFAIAEIIFAESALEPYLYTALPYALCSFASVKLG